MRLTIRAPNLMQRLSELPTVPNVTLLDRRKTKPHLWPHDSTTFTKQIYIRWCCIDLSNAPALPDKFTIQVFSLVGLPVNRELRAILGDGKSCREDDLRRKLSKEVHDPSPWHS